MDEFLGTPFYVAPEIHERRYTQACDYWSIGVITYILLAGYPPFNGQNEHEIKNKIQTCSYEFIDEDWSAISKEAKDFIEKLLNPVEKRRMTP